jgi:hypothetical protein
VSVSKVRQNLEAKKYLQLGCSLITEGRFTQLATTKLFILVLFFNEYVIGVLLRLQSILLLTRYIIIIGSGDLYGI